MSVPKRDLRKKELEKGEKDVMRDKFVKKFTYYLQP